MSSSDRNLKRLIIIGAGGLGREVCGFAHGDSNFNSEWTIAGFLDDRKGVFEGKSMPAPLLGSPQEYEPKANDLFVTAVMDAESREHFTEIIQSRGGIFTNIVHKTSSVSFGTVMGVGNVLGFQVAISCDVRIGSFNIFNSFASVGHDAVIEDYVSIHNRALISGNTWIGRSSQIGSNATVLPKAKVGPRGRVGAGSVLIGRAPSDRLMMGVPARPLDLPGAS